MKVAIAGYGVEGKSSYRYFLAQGHDVAILDKQTGSTADLPEGARHVSLGANAFDDLAEFDIVIRTPSMPPELLKKAPKIWSATNEFFAHCPAPIIGVTGTKGKGTTCSLITAILKRAGKTVHLVGNIGIPALDVLPHIAKDDIVVFELSSFQLWDLQKSPHVAVVLMIEPDHLDVHTTFEEYTQAKQNIVRFQTQNDITIFNAENVYSASIASASRGQKIPVPSAEAVYVKDDYFWHKEQKICPVSSLKIPGVHNQDNACAAITGAWLYVQDPGVISQGLSDFTGLPHRLKLVREVDGVAYYDDSIATTVGSAIAAMKAFTQPKIIILGGSSKGVANFEDIASTAAVTGVKHAVLIGDQAPKIQELLEKHKIANTNLGSNITMSEVVKHASALAAPGDVVILSPACASFGMFKSYSDRGDQFIAAVNEL